MFPTLTLWKGKRNTMKRIQNSLSFLLMLLIFFIVSTDLCAQDDPPFDPAIDPECYPEELSINVIYPNDGQSILNNKPVIQATIISNFEDIDPSSIFLNLNDEQYINIVGDFKITPPYPSNEIICNFEPYEDLKNGVYTVEMGGFDFNGYLVTKTWEFEVISWTEGWENASLGVHWYRDGFNGDTGEWAGDCTLNKYLAVAPISIINDDIYESSKILFLRAKNDPVQYPGSIVKAAVSTTTSNPITMIPITRDTYLSFEGVGDVQVVGNSTYERLVSICLRVWFSNGTSIKYIFQHTSDHPTQWTSGSNTFNHLFLGELSHHARNLWDDYIYSTGQQPPGNLRIYSILPTVYGSKYGLESWAKWNDIKLFESTETPVASFNYAPSDPQAGETVNFSSTSYDPDEDPLTYEWEIKDLAEDGGLIGLFTTEDFTYIFPRDGDYKVTLRVSDGKDSNTTLKSFKVETPPPNVGVQILSTGGSYITMGKSYNLEYKIDNNARVPINVKISQNEIREQLGIELPWDPFKDKDTKLLNFVKEITMPALSIDEIKFPPNPGSFFHQWYWIDSDHWMNLLRAKTFKEVGSALAEKLKGYSIPEPAVFTIKQLLDVMENFHSEILKEQRIESVEYLITDQGNNSRWWVNGEDEYDLSIPDTHVTVNVPQVKKDKLKDSYNLMQSAFKFLSISGDVTDLGAALEYLISGAANINPLNFLNLLKASFFGAFLTTSNISFIEAYDPPDFNYTEIAIPENIKWPEVDELPDCIGRELVIKHLELLSLRRAHSTSIDRYIGAGIDKNVVWMDKQLEAAFNYDRLIADKTAELIPYYSKIASLLPEITDEIIQTIKNEVATEGLPQKVKDVIIRETELSSDEIEDIEDILITMSDDWYKNTKLIPYTIIYSTYLINEVARYELMELIDNRVNLLADSVKELTQEELAILLTLKNEIHQAITDGHYSQNLLEKINNLRAAYEDILKITNNKAAIEPFADTVNNAYENIPIEVIIGVAYVEVIDNQQPISDAGPDQAVQVGDTVTLDGSGSTDPDSDLLTYTWTWDGGSAAGVNPSIQLPVGLFAITLVVNDGTVDSDPDTVNINVVEEQKSPGDLNGDGNIDSVDYNLFRGTLGKCSGQDGFISEADYDEDGCVTYADYRIWYGYYRNQ